MPVKLHVLVVVGALSLPATGEINVPPEYYYVELIPREVGFSQFASINNRGEVVWSTRLGGEDWSNSEIFLYRDGVVAQLTSDTVRDDFPDINDDGTIVWSRADGPDGVLEIVQYRDGEITRITDESKSETARDNLGPAINAFGQIAWHRRAQAVCSGSDAEIYFFDGNAADALAPIGLANQAVDLNDQGEVVWTQYDFCSSPWTSRILLEAIPKLVSGRTRVDRIRANCLEKCHI
ncbi:MAG: hypothetical protein AB7N71_12460 [Phycisphaerae bacterium]